MKTIGEFVLFVGVLFTTSLVSVGFLVGILKFFFPNILILSNLANTLNVLSFLAFPFVVLIMLGLAFTIHSKEKSESLLGKANSALGKILLIQVSAFVTFNYFLILIPIIIYSLFKYKRGYDLGLLKYTKWLFSSFLVTAVVYVFIVTVTLFGIFFYYGY
jgi:hypothetical protein